MIVSPYISCFKFVQRTSLVSLFMRLELGICKLHEALRCAKLILCSDWLKHYRGDIHNSVNLYTTLQKCV